MPKFSVEPYLKKLAKQVFGGPESVGLPNGFTNGHSFKWRWIGSNLLEADDGSLMEFRKINGRWYIRNVRYDPYTDDEYFENWELAISA